MADPQLPNPTEQISKMPYDNSVKAKIWEAYHADTNEASYNAFSSLPISKDEKNLLFGQRQKALNGKAFANDPDPTTAPPAQPNVVQTQTPQQPGILDRAWKNLPRSASNFAQGLVKNINPAAASMDAGLQGAVKIADVLKGPVTQNTPAQIGGIIRDTAFEPIKQFIEHVQFRLGSPLESFAEDPVGTAVDAATIALPFAKGAKTSLAKKSAPVTKPQTVTKPSVEPSPVVTEAPPQTPLSNKSAAKSAEAFELLEKTEAPITSRESLAVKEQNSAKNLARQQELRTNLANKKAKQLAISQEEQRMKSVLDKAENEKRMNELLDNNTPSQPQLTVTESLPQVETVPSEVPSKLTSEPPMFEKAEAKQQFAKKEARPLQSEPDPLGQLESVAAAGEIPSSASPQIAAKLREILEILEPGSSKPKFETAQASPLPTDNVKTLPNADIPNTLDKSIPPKPPMFERLEAEKLPQSFGPKENTEVKTSTETPSVNSPKVGTGTGDLSPTDRTKLYDKTGRFEKRAPVENVTKVVESSVEQPTAEITSTPPVTTAPTVQPPKVETPKPVTPPITQPKQTEVPPTAPPPVPKNKPAKQEAVKKESTVKTETPPIPSKANTWNDLSKMEQAKAQTLLKNFPNKKIDDIIKMVKKESSAESAQAPKPIEDQLEQKQLQQKVDSEVEETIRTKKVDDLARIEQENRAQKLREFQIREAKAAEREALREKQLLEDSEEVTNPEPDKPVEPPKPAREPEPAKPVEPESVSKFKHIPESRKGRVSVNSNTNIDVSGTEKVYSDGQNHYVLDRNSKGIQIYDEFGDPIKLKESTQKALMKAYEESEAAVAAERAAIDKELSRLAKKNEKGGVPDTETPPKLNRKKGKTK